jgi:type I secretion membrane fusion protein, HlyD family
MSELPVPLRTRIPHFAAEELVGDPGTRPLAHATVLIISAMVAVFLAWATITPVEEIASGQGEIVPAGAVQSIEHLEGGIVEDILVKEGELVEQGQTLLRLGSSAAQSNRDQLLTRQETLSLQAERLSAFAEGRSPQFQAVSDKPDLIRDQDRLLQAQIEGREQQERIFHDQILNLTSQLKAGIQKRETLGATLRLINSKVIIRRELVGKGLNSELQLIEVQRERAAATAELQQLDATVAGLDNTIAETRSRIAELHSRLRQEALDKLDATSAELAEIRQQITAQDDRVTRLLVGAPVRGVVQEMPTKTVGGVVQPGAMVAKIVPVNDELIAEIQISPRDIGFVHPGQPVKVKVQAFDYARYGRVEGALERVSPTTFFTKDQLPYYLGRVKLAADHVGDQAGKHLVVPGMTVQADVVTGEKTVLQYLLKPIYTTLEGTFGER